MTRPKTRPATAADVIVSADDADRKTGRGHSGSSVLATGILDQSRITSKGQITLPKTVRASLGVAEGQSVQFRAEGGKIVVEPVSESPADDPAIGAFLDLLQQDIAKGNVVEFPALLKETMEALTKYVEIDPDAPIDGDVMI